MVKKKPGVYLLAIPLKRTSNEPKPLGRFLATDPHGLVDIGEAENLWKRLCSLFDCTSNMGKTGHMAGWRLGSLGLLRKIGCKTEDLLVSWYHIKSKNKSYEREGTILKTYFELFGELPPLNYKYNWSAYLDE